MADLSWTISERISAFAFYGHQEINRLHSGSQSFGSPDWQAGSFDQFDYFLIDGHANLVGLSFRYRFGGDAWVAAASDQEP